MIQWTIWAVIMGLVMGWLAWMRSRPRPDSHRGTLRHSSAVLILGLILTFLCLGLAVVSRVGIIKNSPWGLTLLSLFFTALSSLFVLEYYKARHKLTPEGLHFGKLIGAGGFLRWRELKSVRFDAFMRWFRLESQSGAVARLSELLMGLPEFAELVLKNAPPGSIDAKTLPVLKATASGKLP